MPSVGLTMLGPSASIGWLWYPSCPGPLQLPQGSLLGGKAGAGSSVEPSTGYRTRDRAVAVAMP